jgi:hypothetical protein
MLLGLRERAIVDDSGAGATHERVGKRQRKNMRPGELAT